ncbi:hypothetical protein [Streptomyces sp. NPDC002908]|uniref:hypothetical protein n=1 Tax=Streptomyces sp. NPDC002908 TaxID=3364670 RepID=UPI0036A5A03A
MTDTTDLPARLRAVLTERFTALGNPFSEMRTQEKGPDGWPASHPVGPDKVAEVLRELLADDPARQVLGTTTGQPETEAPADRATVRDRIRRAVCEAEGFAWDTDMLEPDEYGEVADAVLAVLPAPATVDRATVLREAADAVLDIIGTDARLPQTISGVYRAADHLRRLAAEAQQPTPAPAEETK